MSENQHTTDSELILQIVGYNQSAFEELFNRYSATIYSLIREIVTNPKLAEKVLLNVFSVFLKRLEYYSTSTESAFTWLILLARNLSIDTLNRIKFGEDIPEYSDEYEIDYLLPKVSQVISPIDINKRTELSTKIKTYKSNLTEAQNLVLSLVYFEGLNEEEIAKRLNVPVVTVRQKILSIMENLYEQYTGKTENTSNKDILNLIKVEALGCLSSKEKVILNKMRENESDFLWKELGEYQNLTALLSVVIPLQNPVSELGEQIRNLFKAIVQGDQDEVTISRTEQDIIDHIQEPIQEPIQEHIQVQTPSPVPEIIKDTEIPEKNKSDFELKFRERDPEELSILKKLETIETVFKNTPVVNKEEKKIQFKDYVVPEKKSEIAAPKIITPVQIKDSVKEVIAEDKTNEGKTLSSYDYKKELNIDNDDPSIVIDEPATTVLKNDVIPKNRLIPNSSIDLKEFFKKDEVPSANKKIIPDKPKEEKLVEKTPVSQVADNSDIKIKSNEPPKDLRKVNVFVEREEKKSKTEFSVTPHDKVEIQKKLPELNNESKKDENVPVKEYQNPEAQINSPINENSAIKIKDNESPKVFSRSNVFVDKNITATTINPSSIVNKQSEPINPKEETNYSFGRNRNNYHPVQPAVDKTKLKIREIQFTEEDKQVDTPKQEIVPQVFESKPVKDKVSATVPAKESINIDEIIAKIEDDVTEPVNQIKVSNFESRNQKPVRKRKSIYIAAATIVLLAASSVFLYVNYTGTPEQIVSTNSKPEKLNLTAESNFVTNENSNPPTQSETISETQNLKTPELKGSIKENKVVVPPLPEISIKEESTLIASNIKENLLDSPTNEEHQTAAAKTETTIPPKENIKVEEEPAFFVAVEEMPELVGGLKTIQSKIKYPEIASRMGVEGKVLVQAVVDETGNVISVKTLKGIGSGCDEVAMDAVRNSKFTPGKQRGRNVKVQVTIPIVFKK
ncbi:MAG: TonB family protein [Ignavibacterium sp.]|nr:TonB family protein [Ignavibacterium sp.]